jgi:hypothetical protein
MLARVMDTSLRYGFWALLWMVTMSALAGESYPLPPFVPPAGHPRVYFTSKDLPHLRENAAKKQNELAWRAFLKNLETDTDGILPPPKSPGDENTSSKTLSIITSHAYDYILHGNETHGRKAISALRNYLRTVVYAKNDYNNTGQTVFTIAAVYDWCYALLGDDERTFFIDETLKTAAKMEIGWPPVQQGNVTGHGPEGQIFRDLLCAGIAMYDERPDIYNVVAGRFFSRMVEPRRFVYPAHMHPQGSHYTNYRGQWEMLATWILDRIGLPKVFGPDQQYQMYWTLYARRGDGQILRDGDTHINNRPLGEYYSGHFRTMFLAANYFKDPYLKTGALLQRKDFEPVEPRGNQACDCVEMLIFNDPDLSPRDLSELPLTKYFPSPKGAMIARTSWQEGIDSPAVVAEMKINEWYFSNHQHLDAGAFQIYYRGVLANDSGYYQARKNSANSSANDGGSEYGSLYDINYNKRSIAHNVMTVYDPDEKFVSRRWKDVPMSNDGGQRMPNLWIEPKEHEDFLDPANRYRICEVLAHGFGPNLQSPDYTYLKGDLTKAYADKIKAYERSFVFLNPKQKDHPAALVVFDRVVSSNANFRKAWLLHGLEEPSIQGNRTIFKDTRQGYSGKLTVDTLLPEASNTAITKVGGPGRENFVDGINYKVDTRPEGCNEGGGWRVEISPKSPSETNYFLNVLQVGDHTPDVPPFAVEKIETETHVGAKLGDRMVLFAKSRERSRSAISFSFKGEGTFNILVADLQPGSWTIERDGTVLDVGEVPAESGVASFRGAAGSYRLISLP